MNTEEFDNETKESDIDDFYDSCSKFDEMEENIENILDEKLLYAFHLLGRYDLKVERAFREGFGIAICLSIGVIAVLLSLLALLWKLWI